MPRDTSPSLDDTRLTENDTVEAHWASPSTKQTANHAHNDSGDATVPNDGQTMFEKEAAREASLRAELASVRKVNEAIEGMVESLNKAQSNMMMVNSTVSSASTLLNTWTRILSQTEHNQRLILNQNWQGASQDIADAEQEVVLKQQASERREAEEQTRREEKLRRTEEEERRRREAEATPRASSRGSTKGRGRGLGRATSSSMTNVSRASNRNTSTQSAVRATATSGAGRSSSGVGRAYTGRRGRVKD